MITPGNQPCICPCSKCFWILKYKIPWALYCCLNKLQQVLPSAMCQVDHIIKKLFDFCLVNCALVGVKTPALLANVCLNWRLPNNSQFAFETVYQPHVFMLVYYFVILKVMALINSSVFNEMSFFYRLDLEYLIRTFVLEVVVLDGPCEPPL